MSLALDTDFYRLLAGSYRRLVGAPLAGPAGDDAQQARWLYEDAPFCVLAHNTDADPRFIYANRAAQACFEYDWDAFTALPSRLSAEPSSQEDRQRLLDRVRLQGFAAGYRGLRIAKSGRRFWIEDCTIWQLIDDHGEMRGQAATFPRWHDA
ncbi:MULTISPECIES: MEKHLA domain-containing protein [Rhodomicrobium]|uniref:MEKHLA domain-containing protein n=1 Tax=Rhodomicrobium TaxID=1068 RepID=UPI000B4A93E0|nr:MULTISPECIES: MEKHLA domain-containing protein [Rhodomicrobium]